MKVAELIVLLQGQPQDALMFATSADTECAELVSGVALARAEGCYMPTVTILTDDDAAPPETPMREDHIMANEELDALASEHAALGHGTMIMHRSYARAVIAAFLERTGQYVTNDASRQAAIDEAVAADRAERVTQATLRDRLAAEADPVYEVRRVHYVAGEVLLRAVGDEGDEVPQSLESGQLVRLQPAGGAHA